MCSPGDNCFFASADMYVWLSKCECPSSELRVWSIDCFTCNRLLTVFSKQSNAPVGLIFLSVVPCADYRSLKSLSLFSNHSFNTSAVSSFSFPLVSISGVTPCESSVRTTFPCPFAAAKCSGADPEEPTIGTDVSRCLSE